MRMRSHAPSMEYDGLCWLLVSVCKVMYFLCINKIYVAFCLDKFLSVSEQMSVFV